MIETRRPPKEALRARSLRIVVSRDGMAFVILLLPWARGVGSYTAISLTTEKVALPSGGEWVGSPAGTVVSQGAYLLVIALCSVAVLFRINDLPRPGLWRLSVMLLPWLWLLIRDAYSGQAFPDSLMYPFIVLAVAALRPSRKLLGAVGVLVGTTALIALVLGWALPTAGLMRTADGEIFERPEKEILPFGGLLQGMFFSENTMAAFLSVGLACVFAIRTTWLRAGSLIVTVLALLWSSSRGGILTAVIVVAVGALVGVLVAYGRRAAASRWARVAVFSVFAGVAVLPFLGWSDSAFSARGIIWRVSISQWAERAFWFGLDSNWYSRVAQSETSPFHSGAVYAHNDVLQMLVTGGIVMALLFAAWYVVISLDVTRHDNPSLVIAAMLVAGIAAGGALEVVTGFVNGSTQWPVSLFPLAVLFFAPRPTHGGGLWLDVRDPYASRI